ncbi:hypothetical protein [Desulfobaculum sp.]
MAFETGTATDYKDMLAKLKAFAVAQGWTALRYEQGAGHEPDELILRGPDSGGQQVYVGARTETNEIGGYNWRLQGFTGFDPALTFDAQPGAIDSYAPRLLLMDGGLRYWLSVNARRIVVVVKASTTYQVGYLGLILPYGPPSNLPYPLLIGGCSDRNSAWNVQDYYNTPFFNAGVDDNFPEHSSGRFLHGAWLAFSNWYEDRYGNHTIRDDHMFWPATVPPSFSSPTGARVLFPVLLCSKTAGAKGIFGELDGVRYVEGIGIAGEDTIDQDGETYTVFTGGWSTDAKSYIALQNA